MIKRAVKNGFKASYIFMDSWFVNDYMIKSIRSINNGSILDVIPEEIIPKLIKNDKDNKKLMSILIMLNSDNPQFYTENDKMLRAA